MKRPVLWKHETSFALQRALLSLCLGVQDAFKFQSATTNLRSRMSKLNNQLWVAMDFYWKKQSFGETVGKMLQSQTYTFSAIPSRLGMDENRRRGKGANGSLLLGKHAADVVTREKVSMVERKNPGGKYSLQNLGSQSSL